MAGHSLRTLLVGIDGACASVLEPLVAAGSIPTIERVMAEGSTSELESQLPPWTPSAWPTMYTGVNPGKHGVFDFLTYEGYEWRVVNRTDVREHSIWELLSEKGISSVVVNVPVTHPPQPFDGALIPGYVAPEDPDCHPPGLLDDVRNAIGEYRVYGPQLADGISEVERIADYERKTSMRGEAFRYLLDRFEPAFGFLQFQQTDTVCHEFPDRQSVIERVYAAVDRELDLVLREFDPAVVMIVSDHGIGPYSGYEFRVNEYLRSEGYLETVAGEGGMPSWSSISRRRLRQGRDDDGRSTPSAVESMLAVAARFGATSQRLGRLLRTLGLDELVLKYVSPEAVRAASERVDFQRSTAYMRSRTELGVRLNLEGREPNGTVARERYDSLVGELCERFSSVRTPDGRPVFDAALPAAAVFEGPHLANGPDVVLVPRAWDEFVSASLGSEQFATPSEPWSHKLQGTVTVRGEGFGPGVELEEPGILDVAPTVLATLGIHMSERMDGSPMGPIQRVERDRYPEFAGASSGPTEGQRRVEQRLADFGYLE